ncbi:unnamed protein product [Spirodela intermedia]|uniref:Uncharacterized protein n=1 Tax=Spirodela intermedia TaxID=51605 RepID=A0A7I8I965_SPIIN|nr:unnamed protein product [Spirodela intermedia]CAA6654024.1 unnamed protein product [Spirodela intermedia]
MVSEPTRGVICGNGEGREREKDRERERERKRERRERERRGRERVEEGARLALTATVPPLHRPSRSSPCSRLLPDCASDPLAGPGIEM